MEHSTRIFGHLEAVFNVRVTVIDLFVLTRPARICENWYNLSFEFMSLLTYIMAKQNSNRHRSTHNTFPDKAANRLFEILGLLGI